MVWWIRWFVGRDPSRFNRHSIDVALVHPVRIDSHSIDCKSNKSPSCQCLQFRIAGWFSTCENWHWNMSNGEMMKSELKMTNSCNRSGHFSAKQLSLTTEHLYSSPSSSCCNFLSDSSFGKPMLLTLNNLEERVRVSRISDQWDADANQWRHHSLLAESLRILHHASLPCVDYKSNPMINLWLSFTDGSLTSMWTIPSLKLIVIIWLQLVQCYRCCCHLLWDLLWSIFLRRSGSVWNENSFIFFSNPEKELSDVAKKKIFADWNSERIEAS